ncbi:toxin [Chitinophaga polysaccharea]|nr:toxin [Chitinophaga polysaccharea]
MRVFAGPNGSGKSTIIKEIQKLYKTGTYINADDIEKAAKEKGFVNLGDYNLEADTADFNIYLKHSTLLAKAREEGFNIDLNLSNNVITIGEDSNSYEAALISEYLRRLLIAKGETFSFETVMSHFSKLDVLKSAHAAGFKNYLYFISTESADINVNRVKERVEKGGHPVDEQKIRERYIRSMDLVADMLSFCRRCFFFDNSSDAYRLVAEVIDGETLKIETDDIPTWFDAYVLQKLGV